MEETTRPHPLRELVFEYLERSELEGAGVLEELCARRPELATGLRARVRLLRGTGLAGPAGGGQEPERLGAFRLLERIGGGGMGVVYRARDEVMGREVALKLVRPGELLFQGARERFRREIEAVARLSHPGIVPVFSAGEEGGVPFFAMELVRGCTLAEALGALARTGREPAQLTGSDLRAAVVWASGGDDCEDEGWPLFGGSWCEACARIVREVAEALEHAHRRGVLHRDVKPSNVMITRTGRVMLLDFGLSSAEGLGRITRTGSAMGSLPYMSPEQLDGDWEGLDGRGDVYALGVTSYELLSLRLPFEQPSLARMRSAVLEGRPEPLRRCNPRVSWELETVVAAAMDPDRTRRYASAGALASDLSAALEGRPIAARRAGPLRRARRWADRHPAGAALAALAALVVVGGPLLFGWQQRRARLALELRGRVIDRQRQELSERNAELAAALTELQRAVEEAREQRDVAVLQEGRAERNFERAVAAVDTMLTRVAEEELRDVPRLHEVRREVLEDALGFYLELLAERASDDRLRRDTARAWRRVGELHGLLDRSAESQAAFARCTELLAALLEEDPTGPGLLRELVDARQLAALPLRQLGRQSEAEEQVRLAMSELERCAAADVSGARYDLERQSLVVSLAQVLRESGRGGEAREELEAILPSLEASWSEDPHERARTEQLARAHHMLGVLWVEASPPSAEERARVSRISEVHHARALELLEPALALDPDDTDLRRELARSCVNLGSAMLGRGAVQEAEGRIERGAELSGSLREDYPGVATYVEDEATARMLLGAVRASLGRYEEGISLVRDAAAAFERLAGEQASAAGALRKLASARLQEATLAWRIGRDHDDALAALDLATATHLRALELSPGMPQTEMGLEWCHELSSVILLEAGNVAAAGEAALAWAAVAREARRKAAAAARLASCSLAAETGLPPSEARTARVARWDDAAAGLVRDALEGGLTRRELLQDPRFQALSSRPWSSGVLDPASDGSR